MLRQYDIPDLKLLACENFYADSIRLLTIHRDLTETSVNKADKAWFAAVSHIYENSNPTEKGLRASVVKVWQALSVALKTMIGKKPWIDLVAKFPELGVDMIMELDYKGECQTPALGLFPPARRVRRAAHGPE